MDVHDHQQHRTDQAISDIDRLSRERALLRALGAMFDDEDGKRDSGISANEAGAAKNYPDAVKSIGLRLLAMEKEIAHDEKTASPVYKQHLETTDEKKNVKTSVEQRSNHQGIAPIPPAYPYCDLPEHKRPQ